MKKSLKVLALVLILVLTVAVLVACGGPKGEYKDFISGFSSYTFNGNKYTYELGNIKETGTYRINKTDKDHKYIVFTDSDGKETTNTFSEGEENGVKYIKIGSIRYNKTK